MRLVVFTITLMLIFPGFIPGQRAKIREKIIICTELGDIHVCLDLKRAPVTSHNFLRYVDAGLFDSACFYRVVRMDNQPDNPVRIEVIQGGRYDKENNGFPPIIHETTEMTGIRHKKGVISMARNQPGSATSEFFICVSDQPELDFNGKRNPDRQGFAAFGKTVKGMKVVKKIHAIRADGQYLEKPVRISEITRAGKLQAGQTGCIVQVDLAKVHQTIAGFGVASGWTSPTLDDTQADALFTVDKGIGLVLLRMTIQPDGTTLELSAAKQAIARGASVWAAPWSPPAEWKDNHDVNNGGHLLPGHQQDWADRLALFAGNCAAEGVPLSGLSAQNEPGYVPEPPNSWQTCEYSPASLTGFIRDYLGPTLSKQGVNLPIIAPETGGWDKFDSYVSSLLADSAAASYLGPVATHSYSGIAHQPECLQNSGRQVWQTEYSDQGGHMYSAPIDKGMGSALLNATHIHNDLVEGNVSAWHHWTVNPTDSTTNDGLTDGKVFTRRAWVLGNWSRFVRPGFVRVEATSSPHDGILVSAFSDPATSRVVIVFVNMQELDLTQNVSVNNGAVPVSFTIWTTSDTLALKKSGHLAVSRKGTFRATLPARSVTSLVSDLPGTIMPVSP